MSQTKETSSLTTYPIEWIGYVFASLLLLILLNINRFVNILGMNDERTYFKQSATDVFGSFLNYLDTFAITANLVQFLIWFTVGLFVMSTLRTGVQFYQELQDDITIATRYVHPHHFTTATFVRKALLAFAIRYGCLILTATLVYVGFRLVFPLSISLEPANVQHFTVISILKGLAAWLLLFMYTGFLATSAKVLIASRHYHP